MKAQQFKKLLLDLNACEEAIKWAEGKSWEEVYKECHRGDWLLWLFQKVNPDDLQLLTLVKGHCANTVRYLMKDKRSKEAVDIAIKFGEGKATMESLNSNYITAYAAYTVYADYYTSAVHPSDAADAASATYDAVYTASAAYDAVYQAAYAAFDPPFASPAPSVAGNRNRLQTADICRKYLPIEVQSFLKTGSSGKKLNTCYFAYAH